MQNFMFADVMEIIESFHAKDKKGMKKSLLIHILLTYNTKILAKDASFYVNSYSEILNECNKIAVKSFSADCKPDFDALVFSKYPPIKRELKNKWIQRAYMSVFR